MNRNDIIRTVQFAEKTGKAAILFNTTCYAGGYARHFVGKGVLYISVRTNCMTICGEGGYITQVNVYSEKEAVDYIEKRFNYFMLDPVYEQQKMCIHGTY